MQYYVSLDLLRGEIMIWIILAYIMLHFSCAAWINADINDGVKVKRLQTSIVAPIIIWLMITHMRCDWWNIGE